MLHTDSSKLFSPALFLEWILVLIDVTYDVSGWSKPKECSHYRWSRTHNERSPSCYLPPEVLGNSRYRMVTIRVPGFEFPELNYFVPCKVRMTKVLLLWFSLAIGWEGKKSSAMYPQKAAIVSSWICLKFHLVFFMCWLPIPRVDMLYM